MSWLKDTNSLGGENLTYNLIERYLDTLCRTNILNITKFDPWFLLQDTKLAIDIVSEITPRWGLAELDGICILANSGIPLGILLAQSLGKPMYFYRREPYNIEDLRGDFHIFPEPPAGSRICLVDSHITTGFTSTSCYKILTKKGVFVDSLVTPVSFTDVAKDYTEVFERDIKYHSLANAYAHSETLFRIFKTRSFEDIIGMIRNRDGSYIYRNEKAEPPVSRNRLHRLRGIIKAVFKRKHPNIKYLDLNLKKDLNRIFSSSESSTWNFFSQPTWLNITCGRVGNLINLNNYDTIFSTGTFGTFFALCLVWHNKFYGKVLSTYRSSEWDLLMKDKKLIQNCIVCSGRLRTGVAIRGILDYLSREKSLTADKILVLRLATEGVLFPRNLLLYSELDPIKSEILVVS